MCYKKTASVLQKCLTIAFYIYSQNFPAQVSFSHHSLSFVIQQARWCNFFSRANSCWLNKIQLKSHFCWMPQKLDSDAFYFCIIGLNHPWNTNSDSINYDNAIIDQNFILFQWFAHISIDPYTKAVLRNQNETVYQ